MPRNSVNVRGLGSGSKKFLQQGHSHFCAWSVLAIREHGKMTRTPLAAFFNRPILKKMKDCSWSPKAR